MVDHDSTTTGFALYGSERKTRLLLPIQIADELETQAEIAAAEKTAAKLAEQQAAAAKTEEFVKSRSRHAPHANAAMLKKIDFDIESIRTDTKYDLPDAMTLLPKPQSAICCSLSARSSAAPSGKDRSFVRCAASYRRQQRHVPPHEICRRSRGQAADAHQLP